MAGLVRCVCVCSLSLRRPQGMEEEFFVQLFMEPDSSLKLPTIGALLARMFQEQDIKFSKVYTHIQEG